MPPLNTPASSEGVSTEEGRSDGFDRIDRGFVGRGRGMGGLEFSMAEVGRGGRERMGRCQTQNDKHDELCVHFLCHTR